MHELGGIAETRLEVFPGVNGVRRDPGTGGNREGPGTLEEKNTVSETTIASDTEVGRIFAGPYQDHRRHHRRDGSQGWH